MTNEQRIHELVLDVNELSDRIETIEAAMRHIVGVLCRLCPQKEECDKKDAADLN